MHRVLLALVATIGLAAPAAAIILPGDETKRRDCWVGFDITNDRIVESTETRITALAVDKECVFNVRACVGLRTPRRCNRKRLASVEADASRPKAEFPPPATLGRRFACGDPVEYVVPTRRDGAARGIGRLHIVGRTKKGKLDADRPRLYCEPDPDPPPQCPGGCVNPQGGPDRFVFTFGSTGTDLDLGWAGNSFNFVVPPGRIDVCLTGCDGTTDTVCDVCGETGEGSANGLAFGPPLPLFASNIPVCVVHRWRQVIRGTLDEATGATSLDVGLASDLHLTDANAICPQCRNGTCDGGARSGQSCTVGATVPVFVSSTRTDLYELSSQCVPSAPTATLDLDLRPLTSGESERLVGPTPCTRLAGDPTGVPVKPDDCGLSGCGATCTGPACVAQVPDPTNPGSMICQDAKGGLSQMCCNTNTNQPCHPLANGGTLVRMGSITAPQPPLPDVTYPKTNAGVLAATFCVPATGTNTIDSVTGLPGPAAVLLNGVGEWSKAP